MAEHGQHHRNPIAERRAAAFGQRQQRRDIVAREQNRQAQFSVRTHVAGQQRDRVAIRLDGLRDFAGSLQKSSLVAQ